MTIETYPDSPPTYTIVGTGPYNIGHEYDAASDIRCIVLDGADRIELDPLDFTVSPDGRADDGDVTLEAATVTAYAGAQLVILRETRLEQGWIGNASARERAVEEQLDRLTMAQQDAERVVLSSIRADTPLQTIVPVEGGYVSFDENLNPIVVVAALDDAQVSAYMAPKLLAADAATFLQDISPNLSALSGAVFTAGKFIKTTGAATVALGTITPVGEGLIGQLDVEDMRDYLEVPDNSEMQAAQDQLADLVVSSGTYTPVFNGVGFTVNLAAPRDVLGYLRFGDLVHVSGRLDVASVSGSGLEIQCDLPFPASDIQAIGAAVYFFDQSAGTHELIPARGQSVPDGPGLRLNIPVSSLDAGDQFKFTFTYIAQPV